MELENTVHVLNQTTIHKRHYDHFLTVLIKTHALPPRFGLSTTKQSRKKMSSTP